MKAIRAQFKHAHRPPRMLWGIAGVLSGCAMVLWSVVWQQRHELEAAQRALVARQQAATIAAQRVHVVAPAVPLYDASAREMLRERLLPWPAALDAFEAAVVPGVVPTRIEITGASASASLDVNVSGYWPLVEYVELLNSGVPPHGPAWRWSLTRAQLQPGQPGRAEVNGAWADR